MDKIIGNVLFTESVTPNLVYVKPRETIGSYEVGLSTEVKEGYDMFELPTWPAALALVDLLPAMFPGYPYNLSSGGVINFKGSRGELCTKIENIIKEGSAIYLEKPPLLNLCIIGSAIGTYKLYRTSKAKPDEHVWNFTSTEEAESLFAKALEHFKDFNDFKTTAESCSFTYYGWKEDLIHMVDVLVGLDEDEK